MGLRTPWYPIPTTLEEPRGLFSSFSSYASQRTTWTKPLHAVGTGEYRLSLWRLVSRSRLRKWGLSASIGCKICRDLLRWRLGLWSPWQASHYGVSPRCTHHARRNTKPVRSWQSQNARTHTHSFPLQAWSILCGLMELSSSSNAAKIWQTNGWGLFSRLPTTVSSVVSRS